VCKGEGGGILDSVNLAPSQVQTQPVCMGRGQHGRGIAHLFCCDWQAGLYVGLKMEA
jgi:hypothetical protein